MKEQIRQLIASGNIESALELLVQVASEAILLQSQFSSGKKNFNIGLIEHSEWQRICSRVGFAALEMASKLPNENGQPNSNPINPIKQDMDNPLKKANQVFKEIQEDLDSVNFVLSNLQNYCARLDDCLNTPICTPLLDFSKLSDWNGKTNSERKQKIKETMEALVGRKDKILARLGQHVSKQNDETSLPEALILFKKTPNKANWNRLYELLLERFQDKSLYAPTVATSWTLWDTKLKHLGSDLDWSLDYKGSTDEADLWAFIRANSQIKNFNYE